MGALARWARRRRRVRLPGVSPGDGSLRIVHLVRASNGLEPYERFIEALRANPPGIEGGLVLALKGFARDSDAEPYLQLAADLEPEAIFFGDEGLDLGVYLASATKLRVDRYCFMNSFSEPLATDWLAKLDAALARPGVGLVGATGSWASPLSWTAHTLRLRNAYSGVLPAPRDAIAQMIDFEAAGRGPAVPGADHGPTSRWRNRLRGLAELPERCLPNQRFPSYHVRTNAFMISHRTLASLRMFPIVEKSDAHLLENGRLSLTSQVLRRGLQALVVDRHGAVFEPGSWDRSSTFWQGDQEGLMVADNQSRSYERAGPERRRLLSGYAWGPSAAPDARSGAGETGSREGARRQP
jgi:hypothetical protein